MCSTSTFQLMEALWEIPRAQVKALGSGRLLSLMDAARADEETEYSSPKVPTSLFWPLLLYACPNHLCILPCSAVGHTVVLLWWRSLVYMALVIHTRLQTLALAGISALCCRNGVTRMQACHTWQIDQVSWHCDIGSPSSRPLWLFAKHRSAHGEVL